MSRRSIAARLARIEARLKEQGEGHPLLGGYRTVAELISAAYEDENFLAEIEAEEQEVRRRQAERAKQ